MSTRCLIVGSSREGACTAGLVLEPLDHPADLLPVGVDSMPYAQQHYPFSTSEEKFQRAFPADFVAEGIDQTRGWFYTLIVLGTHLFDTAPWKNLIVSGLVLGSDGKKMSKSLRNYPDPEEILHQYGSDALR